ncbi:hypothetical protein B0T16DRAFT_168004 [Cercophora newfieldiana]|uniref:Uncharacterized protein n=1 Tax=Cercophora newfieldiana TaxID=92897 RepID=A0AA39Y6M2_9PEZI|nr:hypothetical protein B0T16DRAFT_168004 [Cercophora newfieldiana]
MLTANEGRITKRQARARARFFGVQISRSIGWMGRRVLRAFLSCWQVPRHTHAGRLSRSTPQRRHIVRQLPASLAVIEISRPTDACTCRSRCSPPFAMFSWAISVCFSWACLYENLCAYLIYLPHVKKPVVCSCQPGESSEGKALSYKASSTRTSGPRCVPYGTGLYRSGSGSTQVSLRQPPRGSEEREWQWQWRGDRVSGGGILRTSHLVSLFLCDASTRGCLQSMENPWGSLSPTPNHNPYRPCGLEHQLCRTEDEALMLPYR